MLSKPNSVVENPRYEDFSAGSRTFNEVANMSQEDRSGCIKLRCLHFAMMVIIAHALDFLKNIVKAFRRGLISRRGWVGPDRLSYIATQPATWLLTKVALRLLVSFPGASGVNV